MYLSCINVQCIDVSMYTVKIQQNVVSFFFSFVVSIFQKLYNVGFSTNRLCIIIHLYIIYWMLLLLLTTCTAWFITMKLDFGIENIIIREKLLRVLVTGYTGRFLANSLKIRTLLNNCAISSFIQIAVEWQMTNIHETFYRLNILILMKRNFLNQQHL